MNDTVLVLVIGIVIWLITREFNCWYWKINYRNHKLDEISQYLKVLVDAQVNPRRNNNDELGIEENWVADDERNTISLPRSEMRIEYSDGSVYVGTVMNDTPNGRGIMTDSKNESLECMFVNGEPYGKGIMVDAQGNKYTVDYMDGEIISKEKLSK